MKKVLNYKQFNESYSRVNNDSVKVGDLVSYEIEVEGNKRLETGTVTEFIPSIDNHSPKFIIQNENGDTDEVLQGSVIEVIQ
jgi:hypothetical protein